jgi:uncharacterized membrane protein (UPF0127 family)
MVNYSFIYNKKKFNLEVDLCRTINQKAWGLMFKRKSRPLLFYFNRSVLTPIHSFFCRPFIAIWLNNKKVVDIKYVRPWKVSVFPKEKFDRLLEIPISDPNFYKFSTIKFHRR